MAKLINLNITKIDNTICVWRDDMEESEDYSYGIALDSARIGFMIPKYLATGVFDDGSVKVGGLFTPTDAMDENVIFLYTRFVCTVDKLIAIAMVRNKMADYRIGEEEAKLTIYKDLVESGVKIVPNALQYLINVE